MSWANSSTACPCCRKQFPYIVKIYANNQNNRTDSNKKKDIDKDDEFKYGNKDEFKDESKDVGDKDKQKGKCEDDKLGHEDGKRCR